MNKLDYKYFVLVIGFSFLLLLSACNHKLVPETEGTQTHEVIEEAVPSFEIPDPTDEFAVIYGQILDEETGKPPENAIYLAKNLTVDNDELPAYFSFSYTNSPRGFVDENGFFLFREVPEGQYAILLFDPGGNHYLVDNGKTDETQDYLWINAVPNESLDMGTIIVP